MSTQQIPSKKIAEKPSKDPSNYEKTLSKQVVLILTTIIFAFLVRKLYLYQQRVKGAEKELEYVYDFLTHGMLYGVIYTLFDFLAHHYLQDYVINYYIDQSKYPNQQAMQKRAYSLVKWAYSTIFYSSCSIMNLYLFCNTSYAPEWLGGQNGYQKTQNYFLNFNEDAYAIKLLYMIEFGKHFSRLIIHSFVRQEGNYYEFTLHHMLSVALIVFSYLSNQWLAGMVVLFTHDASDALFLIARLYKEYKNQKTIGVVILGGLGALSWTGLRGVVFPLYLVWPVFNRFLFAMPYLQDDGIFEIVYWPGMYISLMLCVLQVMDYIWIYGLLKGLYNLATQNSSSKIKKSKSD